MKLQGRQTWKFGDQVFLNSTGTAVGPMESEGPLGSLFDVRYNDLHCNEKTGSLRNGV